MSDERLSSSRIQEIHSSTTKAQQAQAAQKLAQYAIAQESAAEEFQEWGDLNAWNPLALARNFQTLDKRAREKGRSEEGSKTEKEDEEELKVVGRLQRISEEYQRKNPELQARTLLLLRSRLKKEDTEEEILQKVRDTYADLSLADEALDFLVDTTDPDICARVQKAKDSFNQLFEREIKAGRNMGIQAREFSAQGLGTPTALRDLYRDITSNPRDAYTLFQQLSNAFPYDKMKTIIDFMLHSLGADVKSKGPSISRQELSRFMTETRNMQAILGIYRFFKSRMRLILSSFARQDLEIPPRLSFELLAKMFMKFIQERYPSVEKALLLSQQMEVKEILAQIILFVQFRDAMRQTAPKLFKDERHRQELLLCFMDTLEELDEELEEDKDD